MRVQITQIAGPGEERIVEEIDVESITEFLKDANAELSGNIATAIRPDGQLERYEIEVLEPVYEITVDWLGEVNEAISELHFDMLTPSARNGWWFEIVPAVNGELRCYAYRQFKEAETHPIKYLDWRTVTEKLKYTVIGQKV